jgi:tetratricopeptide (TPR) repeat protein
LKPESQKNNALYLAGLASLTLYNLIDIGIYFPLTGIIGVIFLSQIFPSSSGDYKIALISVVILALLLITVTVSDDYFIQGELYFSQQQHQTAKEYYYKSLDFNPANFKSMTGLANVLLGENEEIEAGRYLDRSLRLFPQFPYANYLKSRMEAKKGRYLSALYHASLAYQRNQTNQNYKRWYESLKTTISANLSKSEN